MERYPQLRPSKEEGATPEQRRGGHTDLSSAEHTNFSLSHKHSGLHGDGQRVNAASLSTVDPFPDGFEPTYTPVNAPTSGRKYRIQVIEVTDPDTQVISPVLQVIPA